MAKLRNAPRTLADVATRALSPLHAGMAAEDLLANPTSPAAWMEGARMAWPTMRAYGMAASKLPGLVWNSDIQFGGPSNAGSAPPSPQGATPQDFHLALLGNNPAGPQGSGFGSIKDLISLGTDSGFSSDAFGTAPRINMDSLMSGFKALNAGADQRLQRAGTDYVTAQMDADKAMPMPQTPMLPVNPPRDMASIVMPSLMSNVASAISGNPMYANQQQNRLETEDTERRQNEAQNIAFQRSSALQEHADRLQMQLAQLQEASQRLNAAQQGKAALELSQQELQVHAQLADVQGQIQEHVAQLQAAAEVQGKQLTAKASMYGSVLDYAARIGAMIDKNGEFQVTDPSKFLKGAGNKGEALHDFYDSFSKLTSGKGPKSKEGQAAVEIGLGLMEKADAEQAAHTGGADGLIQWAAAKTGIENPENPTPADQTKYIAFLQKAASALQENWGTPGVPQAFAKITTALKALAASSEKAK